MEGNKLNWKTRDELPLVEPMFKKVVLLVEGRFDAPNLHVMTDYWQVQDTQSGFVSRVDKSVEREGKVLYGKLMEFSSFDKVKAWIWAEELIKEYKSENQ